MKKPVYIMAIDIGTTGVKTCLYEVFDQIKLVASGMEGYKLYIEEGGGAEQDPEEWWEAICKTTNSVIEKAGIEKEQIVGVSFCSQMQGVVLVDQDGNPVRRAMSYMDQRATDEFKQGIAHGLKVAGVNVFKLIKYVYHTGVVAASVKDPIWKYKWVEANEPELFNRVYKWLDVKEYIISRFTNRFVMTEGSAFATLLYGTRKGKEGWNKSIYKMVGVNPKHLPEIIKSTDVVGTITPEAAKQLGLSETTKVFGGGGDMELIGIGAGCVDVGKTHIYMGTSGWVSTICDKQSSNLLAMIGATVGVQSGYFNTFAEMETAGKCLNWVKDHLACDEIGVYLQKIDVAASKETVYTNLYEYVCEVILKANPGSDGVIFTPWLHGNRCPFEDSKARGMFFNISLQTGKTELIRAVIEGVCFHLRWMLEKHGSIKTSPTLRFVGGGALADSTSQILADIIGRPIETVENPQNAGAVGAALVVAVGMGLIEDFSKAKHLVPVLKTYTPNVQNKAVYDKNFAVFKKLYDSNNKHFERLNG